MCCTLTANLQAALDSLASAQRGAGMRARGRRRATAATCTAARSQTAQLLRHASSASTRRSRRRVRRARRAPLTQRRRLQPRTAPKKCCHRRARRRRRRASACRACSTTAAVQRCGRRARRTMEAARGWTTRRLRQTRRLRRWCGSTILQPTCHIRHRTAAGSARSRPSTNGSQHLSAGLSTQPAAIRDTGSAALQRQLRTKAAALRHQAALIHQASALRLQSYSPPCHPASPKKTRMAWRQQHRNRRTWHCRHSVACHLTAAPAPAHRCLMTACSCRLMR